MPSALEKSLKKENIYFLEKTPSLNKILKIFKIKTSPCLIILDQKLKAKLGSCPKNAVIYYVRGSESLKNIENFKSHVQKILKKTSQKKINPSYFIGIGGGSVTDFTGFLAGIYKRGRPVFFIPTTLLAAMDAAHGGKTALNVLGVKNVLGSYHFPKGVLIVKNLILSTKKEVKNSNAELVKSAFIKGRVFYKKLKDKKELTFKNIWPHVPYSIKTKLDLVKKDPFSQNKRNFLNLGHTFGHAMESFYQIPHGQAIALGLLFAIEWSEKKKFLPQKKAKEMTAILCHYTSINTFIKKRAIPPSILKKLLLQDKKMKAKGLIHFVFLKKEGQPIIRSVSINELCDFYKKDFLKNNEY